MAAETWRPRAPDQVLSQSSFETSFNSSGESSVRSALSIARTSSGLSGVVASKLRSLIPVAMINLDTRNAPCRSSIHLVTRHRQPCGRLRLSGDDIGPKRSLGGDDGGPVSEPEASGRSPGIEPGIALMGAGVGRRIGGANGGGVGIRLSPARSLLPAPGLGGRGVVVTSGVRAPPSGPRDSLATRLLSAKTVPSSTAEKSLRTRSGNVAKASGAFHCQPEPSFSRVGAIAHGPDHPRLCDMVGPGPRRLLFVPLRYERISAMRIASRVSPLLIRSRSAGTRISVSASAKLVTAPDA